jgi:hypothetical protein
VTNPHTHRPFRLLFQICIPLDSTMDDEDAYGIPSDYYYSEAMPQNYSDNAAISSFDDILDEIPVDDPLEGFSECMRIAGINTAS